MSVQIALAVTALLAAVALATRFLRRGEQVVLEHEPIRRGALESAPMESGSGPQSPAARGSGQGPPPALVPQSPAPGPVPGPQSPAPGRRLPPRRAPSRRAGAPSRPAHGGPVPPGGWQQPSRQQGYQPPGQLASWGSRLGAYADRRRSSRSSRR